MLTARGYDSAVRAAQGLLTQVDRSLVVDGSWGKFTQDVYSRASSLQKMTVDSTVRAIAGTSVTDLAAFRAAQKAELPAAALPSRPGELTRSVLIAATGATPALAAKWLQPLSRTCQRYEINTDVRLAAFLAQIGHESGGLAYTREIWGPTPQQLRYEKPSSLAKDLGNTEEGDGSRFRGRGLIQITGRSNYTALSKDLGVDAVTKPELLEQSPLAADVAGWFWNKRKLNRAADVGDFKLITRRINGGLTGYGHRLALYQNAKNALA